VGDDQRLTKTGIALGTPHYISPEQARGERDVDHRSDIYSLGATLYVLLTGQVPFDGRNNAEIMLKHLKEELENPQDLVPEISDGAAAIVAKMMAKKPPERYDACEQVNEDIDRVLSGQPPSYALAGMAESSIRPARRHRPRAGGRTRSSSGCLGVLLGGVAVLGAAEAVARWWLA
jgi:eukaryotic-like serine/threonine-protein kinase